MDTNTGWRRRTFLVHKGIQFRFIGLLALQMGIILGALLLLVRSHVTRIAEIAEDVPQMSAAGQLKMQMDLLDAIQGFGMRAMGLLLLTGLVIIGVGLFASHRLAGPVIKLERFLRRLADGDFTHRIAFRGTDHLDDFADRVNRMADSLERRQVRSTEIVRALDTRAEMLVSASADDRSRALAEMRHLVAELKGAV